MTISYIGAKQSPRSDQYGSSPRHSSRGKSLDMELRNAPCYHAAIMRLLPSSMRRALTLHHPAPHAPPAPHASPLHLPHPHRECLCDRDRDRRHYRKDWRCDHHTRVPAPAPPPPPLAPPPVSQEPRTSSSPADAYHSFRSGTVYLEVKLVELLSRHQHDSQSTRAVPDANCFGVCWQLLGELSRMKTPFARTFSAIVKGLDRSIHSSYVAAKEGSAFQCVPYFELISKLGDQKLEIEVERENLKTEVLACQAEIGRVEQDIEVSYKKLEAAEGVGREMERNLSAILDDLEGILEQVRTLQGEMLDLKRKMQIARVEQAKAHEVQYEQMVRKEHYAKLEENYKSMLQDLQEAQVELDKARREAFDSIPKEELGAAKAKVGVLQKTLSELKLKADEQIATSGELTPRPVWEELLLLFTNIEYSKKPTAELLVDICKHNVHLTHNISQLHEECATAQASIFETSHDKLHLKDQESHAAVESKRSTPRNETNKLQEVPGSILRGKKR